jgi:urease subunit beta
MTNDRRGRLVPGEVVVASTPVRIHDDPTLEVLVRNTGDRPIQVGSHFHFAEANDALEFDRATARGHRLAIPAGTALRFEPGLERTVPLTELKGRRVVAGLRGKVGGPLDQAGSST